MGKAYKPDGYNTASPYLILDNAAGAIEFLRRTFDAVELCRFPNPTGGVAHAELRIGDTVIMLGDGPAGSPANAAHVHVYVPDADQTYRAALEAGAESVQEPIQRGDPNRRSAVRDSSGTTWWISTFIG